MPSRKYTCEPSKDCSQTLSPLYACFQYRMIGLLQLLKSLLPHIPSLASVTTNALEKWLNLFRFLLGIND